MQKKFAELVSRQFALCFEYKCFKHILSEHKDWEFPWELKQDLEKKCSTDKEKEKCDKFKRAFGIHFEHLFHVFKEMKHVPKRTAHPLQHMEGQKISIDDVQKYVEDFFANDSKKSEILKIFQIMKTMMKKTFQCNQLFEVTYEERPPEAEGTDESDRYDF